jgi:hypothetical protein
LTLLVMSQTGVHLQQLVGVLGWLDAPVPMAAVFAFWAVVGALAALAFLEQPHIALVGVAAIAATVVTAWVLELGQGATYGNYWQGRYSMPYFVGIPLLFAMRPLGGSRPRRVHISRAIAGLSAPLLATVWFVMNLGLAGALHRWGVGLGGSWAPQRWNTWDSPLAPWLLLVVHGIASAFLLMTVHHDVDPTDIDSAGRGPTGLDLGAPA